MLKKPPKFLDSIIDLVFPKFCQTCNQEETWLCSNCYSKLSRIILKESFCAYCQQETKQGKICSACKPTSHLDRIIFCLDYNQTKIKTLVKTFKFGFIQDLAKPLAKFILHRLENLSIPLNSTSLAIVALPLHKRRLRWRGFNQADLIAQHLSSKTNLPYFDNAIIKTKNTQPQSNLSGTDRRKNLDNCFVVAHNPNLNNKTILLIDDVTTTHTTLEQAARAIKQTNKINEIWGITIASS